jgi:hypothetical protein
VIAESARRRSARRRLRDADENVVSVTCSDEHVLYEVIDCGDRLSNDEVNSRRATKRPPAEASGRDFLIIGICVIYFSAVFKKAL